MLQFTIKSFDQDIDKALASAHTQLVKAMNAAGSVLAEELAAKIRSMIPDSGGWYDIYSDAIDFIEISPSQWGVAGFSDLEFDKVEADKSLLWFQGGSKEAQLLSQYNPWTISEIPAIDGGISGDVLVRPASASEVTFHCDRLRAEIGAIRFLLARLNYKVEENGLPLVNGRVVADIDFLIRRLEFGLCGFPRTPIWTKAPAEAEKLARSEDVAAAFDRVIKGGKGEPHGRRDSGAAADLKSGK